ncbi:MAG: PAS domain S-box protein, partial [Desulfuromonadales bacterium]
MTSQIIQKRRIETFRIVAIYSLFGFVWIYGSDTVLGWLVHEHDVMVKIAVFKGSLFILCTATLLYFLINRFSRKLISAESARLESLTNYQTIFNTTNEAILIHDARSGRILDVNDRMLEIYGYTRKEALAVKISDLSEGASPYSQADAAESVRKALFEGPQVFEWHSRKKNGELFWSEVSLRRITIQEADRIIAVVRDINERKQLNDVLKLREKRHQTILDSAIDGFWVVNHAGRLLEVNDAYCRMSGYSRQELLTMSIADFDVTETAEDTVAHIDRIMAQGSDRFVARHRHKDGTVYDVEVSSTFIAIEGGILVGFLRDISVLKSAQAALEESTAKIVSLVNNVPGHVAFVNAATLKYEFVNVAFEKSFGMPQEKITGSFVKDIIGENNFQFALKYIEEARAGKTASYENVFDLVSGKRWIQVNYNPIKDTSGQVVSIVVHSFDITNLKEHENERLKIEKLESLGVLAGGIAHDFNNILTGIMGNISLAKRFIDDTHKSFNALEGAEKASVRATELAQQLLTFAKGGKPVKRVVSVQDIVNESISLVLHGSNVKGTVDIPDSIHPMEADEGQLSQVFHNILINATQAMPGGGVVTVSARNSVLEANNSLALPPGPYVSISFTDEGCGIADADLNKIFDPYFTTKASGNGLGLASCRSIIIRHGGHIGVISRICRGTTFTIHLPSTGTSSVSESHAESDSKIPENHKGGTILIMDDEQIIRDLAAAILEELGYQVTTCRDGAEAIWHYKHVRESGTPFLAVIMDLTIPGGMGGKEAAQEILAIDPNACLIVSSGYSNDPIMSDYRSHGFAGAIAKPYRVSDLER